MSEYNFEDSAIINKALRLLIESFQKYDEHHIFDFDETLAFIPTAQVKIFLDII